MCFLLRRAGVDYLSRCDGLLVVVRLIVVVVVGGRAFADAVVAQLVGGGGVVVHGWCSIEGGMLFIFDTGFL